MLIAYNTRVIVDMESSFIIDESIDLQSFEKKLYKTKGLSNSILNPLTR